jgi:hypothetical protein
MKYGGDMLAMVKSCETRLIEAIWLACIRNEAKTQEMKEK